MVTVPSVPAGENVVVASTTRPGSIPPAGRDLYARMQSAYLDLKRTGCTGCGYCLPCPSGVFIPRVLSLLDECSMFPESPIPAMSYGMWLPAANRADRCTSCGSCESQCPQKLPVAKLLAEAHAALAGGASGG